MVNMLVSNINQTDLIRQVRILKEMVYAVDSSSWTKDEWGDVMCLLDILDDMKYGDFNAN